MNDFDERLAEARSATAAANMLAIDVLARLNARFAAASCGVGPMESAADMLERLVVVNRSLHRAVGKQSELAATPAEAGHE